MAKRAVHHLKYRTILKKIMYKNPKTETVLYITMVMVYQSQADTSTYKKYFKIVVRTSLSEVTVQKQSWGIVAPENSC